MFHSSTVNFLKFKVEPLFYLYFQFIVHDQACVGKLMTLENILLAHGK